MNKITVLIEGYAKEVDNGMVASGTTTLIQTGKINIIVDPGTNKELLLKRLSENGLTTNDINYVFLTHFHIDHVLLTALFEKAKVFDGETIYEDDLETGYENYLPGTDIEVVKTPGHASEQTSLIVKTVDGIVAIASDLFWWMEGEEYKTDTESILNRDDVYMKDKNELVESRKKILDVADWIIPGHGGMFKVEK